MFKEGWYEHPHLGRIKVFLHQRSNRYLYRPLRKQEGKLVLMRTGAMNQDIWDKCYPTPMQQQIAGA